MKDVYAIYEPKNDGRDRPGGSGSGWHSPTATDH